jgi:hypothetical protein
MGFLQLGSSGEDGVIGLIRDRQPVHAFFRPGGIMLAKASQERGQAG